MGNRTSSETVTKPTLNPRIIHRLGVPLVYIFTLPMLLDVIKHVQNQEVI